jgi:hypothetical protein
METLTNKVVMHIGTVKKGKGNPPPTHTNMKDIKKLLVHWA